MDNPRPMDREPKDDGETRRREAVARIAAAQRDWQRLRPGPSERRQPVHTVYGGAQLFRSDIAQRLGRF